MDAAQTDGTNQQVPSTSNATHRTPLGPVSPRTSASSTTGNKGKTNEPEEADDIDKLPERAGELGKQLTREESQANVPLVKDVETPTQGQIDRHEATHTPYRKPCKQCNQGLVMGDQNGDKSKSNIKTKARTLGGATAPDT